MLDCKHWTSLLSASNGGGVGLHAVGEVLYLRLPCCLCIQCAEIIFLLCHQAAQYSRASTRIFLLTFRLSSRKLSGPFIIYGLVSSCIYSDYDTQMNLLFVFVFNLFSKVTVES